MVPGQIALLVGGILCALLLFVMGYLSFSAAKKERRAAARKKAREESERRLQQAREDAAFDQKLDEELFTAQEDLFADNEPLFAEDTPLFAQEEPPILQDDDFFTPAAKPTEDPRPRTTRNDFDFKF